MEVKEYTTMSRTAMYVFIGLGVAFHLLGTLARPLAGITFQELMSADDIRRF